MIDKKDIANIFNKAYEKHIAQISTYGKLAGEKGEPIEPIEAMPPIREVDLSNKDFTLEYWQREAECQKNWREAAEKENALLRLAIKNKNFVAIVEENDLLKEQLINKSEIEQALQSALQEIEERKACESAQQEVIKQYKNALQKLQVACSGVYTRTTESKQFKEMIKPIIDEVLK